MPLSDVAIRAAKPREEPYKMFDERGLFLLVTPTGSKLWRFKYMFDGREKLLSFGSFPDVPLRVASDKRDEARRTLSAAEPMDPSAKRQAERAARADTFGLIAEEWLQMKRKVLSQGTWERDHYQLTKVVGPYLGNRPIASIEAAELLTVLRRLEARWLPGRPETTPQLLTLSKWANYCAPSMATRGSSQPMRRSGSPRTCLYALATQVIAILRELQPVTGNGRYCFPALGSGIRPLSDNTLNAALRRLGYSGDEHTAHGFRSMASTLLNEQHGGPSGFFAFA
jgi:hypothetical protein